MFVHVSPVFVASIRSLTMEIHSFHIKEKNKTCYLPLFALKVLSLTNIKKRII